MSEIWIPRHGYANEANFLTVLHEARFAGGIAASGQRAGFGGQLFSRDSLRVMMDTMDFMPSMSRELFSTLPQMQGVEDDLSTNESPDAMPHQTFRQFSGGRRLPDRQVENVEYWTEKWGVQMKHNSSEGKHFTVYNSSDAPLLYLVALAQFVDMPGSQGVMNDEFKHIPTGETRSVGQAARRCVTFIMNTLSKSEERGSGLYAVPNTNPLQTSPSGVMRDGFDAYFHPEGEFGRPIDYNFVAYIENQGLAFDALHAAAKLFPDDPECANWIAAAGQLRALTFDKFLMPESGLFAAAIDSDGTQVKLKSTAMAELLNGNLLKVPEGPDMVKAIVEWLESPEVMTPAGPRMLSREHDVYESEFYAYQGVGATWPHVNGIIAKGLRNHWGLPTLSHDIGMLRTLGSMDRGGEAWELIFVHKETGEPLYHPSREALIGAIGIAAAEIGQVDQAWAASAGIREIRDWRERSLREEPGTWRRSLARRAMDNAASIPPASSNRPTADYYIDLKRGKELKNLRAQRLNLAA